MTAPKHLPRSEFVVRCGDGSVRHSGQFRDRSRAQHWADQGACCPRSHTVAAVLPELEVA